nr:hypothetical protein [Micromonospora chaiyaphumensis]
MSTVETYAITSVAAVSGPIGWSVKVTPMARRVSPRAISSSCW